MITWMQTHKKWLIVTIWIATIAFVGAGAVGWGSMSFGTKDNTFAKVGETVITVEDIQREYEHVYNEYAQKLGKNFTPEIAKQFEDPMLQNAKVRAFQTALLQEFGRRTSLFITDEEVAKAILSVPYFQKGGKFDEKTYKELLQKQNLNKRTFEESIKRDLLIAKITHALSPQASALDQKSLASVFLMQDKVSVQIIDTKDYHVEINETMLKTFWEKRKNDYLSEKTYTVSYSTVPVEANLTDNEIEVFYKDTQTKYVNEKGEILTFEEAKEKAAFALKAKKSKTAAKKLYVDLKNGSASFEKNITVTYSNKELNKETMDALTSKNSLIKPILVNDHYIIAHLDKVSEPKPLSFEKAKEAVTKTYIEAERTAYLKEKSESLQKNFKGKSLGFVGKDVAPQIKELSSEEATLFLSELFESEEKSGYVLIPAIKPTKAVVFNISEQKLLNEDKYKQFLSLVDKRTTNLMKNETVSSLLEILETSYETVQYRK